MVSSKYIICIQILRVSQDDDFAILNETELIASNLLASKEFGLDRTPVDDLLLDMTLELDGMRIRSWYRYGCVNGRLVSED